MTLYEFPCKFCGSPDHAYIDCTMSDEELAQEIKDGWARVRMQAVVDLETENAEIIDKALDADKRKLDCTQEDQLHFDSGMDRLPATQKQDFFERWGCLITIVVIDIITVLAIIGIREVWRWVTE
jgi:hypothetical protein